MYACRHIHIDTYVHIDHTYIHTYILTYVRTYIHTYTHTHTHIYIYVYILLIHTSHPYKHNIHTHMAYIHTHLHTYIQEGELLVRYFYQHEGANGQPIYGLEKCHKSQTLGADFQKNFKLAINMHP